MNANVKEIEMKLSSNLLDRNSDQIEEKEISKYDITRAAHPGVCFFHVFFKFCAFFSYLFLSYIISSSLYQYIFIMIFHSLDFYTVKNITGRFLVGLRWYSDFGPKGEEIWKFESFDLSKRSKIDSTIFWTFQFGASCAWGFFVFVNILSLGFIDIIFAGMGASFSWINLWGFYKSSRDQQKKMKKMQGFLAKQGVKFMMK